MLTARRVLFSCLLLLATAPTASSASSKPRLELTITPRVAVATGALTMTARLVGGSEAEELYCPTVRWEWDVFQDRTDRATPPDWEARHAGTRDGESETAAECPPFIAGQTAVQRSFRITHTYAAGGQRLVRVSLLKAGRVVATASAFVRVNPKPGAPE